MPSLLKDLPINEKLIRALDLLGFTEATEVQAQAIPPALAGEDLMVSAKTGSGKTVAFLLPTLNKLLSHDNPKSGTLALILLPTRELAIQTQKAFEQLTTFTHLKCGLIIGGEAFKHQVATLRKNPEMLIATPGRLVEHIERGTVDFKDLEFLILDEADRMLDMGFSEDMYTISSGCNESRQNLLFSATLQHKGIQRIGALLTEPKSIVIDAPQQGHSHINQQIVLADNDKHKEHLIVALVTGLGEGEGEAETNETAEQDKQKVFIFCKTRLQCQQLGNILKYRKLRAGYIHGEVPQSIRKQIMNQFRSGQLEVLVATDIAARGLDVDNVDMVINYTVAHSGSDHIHRIGRTGRAGKEGRAVTLVGAEEWGRMSSIERYLKIRFEKIALPGLKANYKGPKKLKSSGKAAGTKKKKETGKKKVRKKDKKTASTTGTENKPSGFSTSDDGFGVLRKK